MARYKETDNSQGQFLAVNLKEQIMRGTFEWTGDHYLSCPKCSKYAIIYVWNWTLK